MTLNSIFILPKSDNDSLTYKLFRITSLANNNSLIVTREGKRKIVHFKPIKNKNEDLNSWWVLKYNSNANFSGYFLQHVKTQRFLSVDKVLKLTLAEDPHQDQVVTVTKSNLENQTEKLFYMISFKDTKKDEISPNLYQHQDEMMEDIDINEKEKLKLELVQEHTFYDFQLCLSVKRLLKKSLSRQCDENEMLPYVNIALTKLSKFIINEKLSHIKFNAPITPTRRHIHARQKLLADLHIIPILCQKLQQLLSQSQVETQVQSYNYACQNILKLLFDISSNNSEGKKELLINVMRIPKELWNTQSLFFQNLLQSIVEDYPISLNTTQEEEDLIIEIAQHITDRIPLVFNPQGIRMNIGELSVLKKLTEINWIHKNQVIKRILDFKGMKDFLLLVIKFISYLGGKQEKEDPLANLRINM